MRAKQIQYKKETSQRNDGFSAFIEEIKEGNVLLMVGHAFEANREAFEGDFYDYLLRELNELSGTKGLDFSDLSFDNRFLLDKENHNHVRSIHDEIVNLIESNEYCVEEDVSNNLLRLIKTGLFRFVFTTSFDPLVEIAMRKQFGTVRVMNIYDKSNRDISSIVDFEIPTIYYLFGKAEQPKDNEVRKKFVATDNDALEVLRKWQLDMSNSTLLKYTADKYILTLGCTQDDWLFRFIWYTMKGESGKLSRGMISGHEGSESLHHYLKMNHILIDNNPDDLVDKIINSIGVNNIVWELPPSHCDVFISYSRADSSIVEQLYDDLTSRGLKVWYDKLNLGGRHGGYFMPILREAIDTSLFFIAILSKSISAQSKEPHVYRREWEWAKELKFGLTADCRCYAAYADDYDINERKYMDGLGWLADIDNYEFSHDNPDFSEWAKSISSKISRIKNNGQ